MKPLIYIAGPYRRGSLTANIQEAISWASAIRKRGGLAYVPHAHGMLSELVDPVGDGDAYWLEHGLAMVARCDGLLRIPGESSGADAEVALAEELGIPVRVLPAAGEPFDTWMDRCRAVSKVRGRAAKETK